MYLKLLPLVGLAVASLVGCTTTVPRDPMVFMPDANAEIVKGGRYELEVKSDDRSKLSYIGEVKDVNDSFVVFDGAVKRAEVESSPPFPVLNKFFVNKP